MRTITLLASASFVVTTLLAGVAAADERIHITPPISRENARVTQAIRPASELTVTPQPVAAAAGSRHVTSSAALVANADR